MSVEISWSDGPFVREDDDREHYCGSSAPAGSCLKQDSFTELPSLWSCPMSQQLTNQRQHGPAVCFGPV